ncbi:hypothetical protein EHQ53_02540 [Leptospira langatensis]|uniref:Uncharacterized protein n=1 Tax=Leptospira langatensis TaxID=2484983 RepID=A0A5F1ZZT6_9LEPT|nr:hypothetical protein [Leptospira langatensis]TGJ98614.1 hypothetical protein EHO57_18680 [Leptospira langatensis]TGL43527.1 hypothetical protein EHQ53_02540 [Leptospira langatensis]
MKSALDQNPIFLSVAREIHASASTGKILEILSNLNLEGTLGGPLLDEIRSKKDTAWDFRSIVLLVRAVQENRQSLSQTYEEAMARYSKVNTLTAKRRANEEEVRLKQTLTDYILKIESNFEKNDRADESMFKELSKFLETLESADKLSEANIGSLNLSPKAVSSVTPILEKYEENLQEYTKLKPVLGRLIRIADYIIEDAES